MSASGDAAEQVVRMMLEGTEVLVKLTGSGAKNAAVLLYSIAKEQNKTRGSERLSNMLRSGKPLKVYTFKQENLEQFKKCAKEYGILYTVLKAQDDKDGMFDVLVRADDDSKLARVIQRFQLTNIDTATLRSEIVKEKEEEHKSSAEPEQKAEESEDEKTEAEDGEKEEPEKEKPSPERNRADADALLGKGSNENGNPTEAREEPEQSAPPSEEGKTVATQSREVSPKELTGESNQTPTEKKDENLDAASSASPSSPSSQKEENGVKRKSVIEDINRKRKERAAKAKEKQKATELVEKAPAQSAKPKER